MHEHHRERMRERYRKGGFNHFSKHELLEMLLFYSLPRGNTNPTAHGLIERFGSIKSVMEASPDELKSVKGVGDRSAILIKLVTALAREYFIEVYNPDTICYHSVQKIGYLLSPRFTGLNHEVLYMALFNNRMNLLDCMSVSEGVVNCSSVSIRQIAEIAYQKNASYVVLAHNHPDGVCMPSDDDLEVNDCIQEALSLMGIVLVEHLIVTGVGFYALMRSRYHLTAGNKDCLRQDSERDRFYEKFYDIPDEEYRFEQPLCD